MRVWPASCSSACRGYHHHHRPAASVLCLPVLWLQDDKGKSKCFGFINYSDPVAAAKAVDDLTGKEVNGKSLYAGR